MAGGLPSAFIFGFVSASIAKPNSSGFSKMQFPFYEGPGGIRVRLLTDDSDSERFIELVEYIDESAYRQDDERVRSDPAMAQFLERWRALLEGPPTVEIYREAHTAHI